MSDLRNIAIASFQERVGLDPPRGQRLDHLERMQRVAFDLIKILELEKSGIREGDGYWTGCDPVAETVFQLDTLERERHETTNDMPVQLADDLPF